MGAGRTELLRLIYGLDKADSGTVSFDRGDGKVLRSLLWQRKPGNCSAMLRRQGTMTDVFPWAVWQNITAPNLYSYKKGMFLDYTKQRQDSEEPAGS